MTGGRRRRRDSGRAWLAVLLAVVLVVAAGAVAAYSAGLLDDLVCEGGDCEVVETLPPLDPQLPADPPLGPVLAAPTAPALDAAAVLKAVAPLLSSKAMGPHVGFAVADLDSGEQVWSNDAGPVVPASTMKILTALAAMRSVGADTRFRTTVVRASPADGATGTGATPGAAVPQIVLVGGGDPYLTDRDDDASRAAYPRQVSLDDLARQTARALRADGVRRVRLGYDASLFTGPAVSPSWEPGYISSYVTTPVSALWVDQGEDGWQRVADPAAQAAATFAARLRAHGVRSTRVAPQSAGDDADEIAEVSSGTVAQIAQRVLEDSDNEGAEVLLRHVAIAAGEPASFAGGARAAEEVLAGLGVPTEGLRMHDGSGLSRADRISPETLLDAVVVGRDLFDRYPVGGFNGSLAARFTAPGTTPALGEVRAKTGTLSGVHGLAGITVDADGTPLAFVAVADRVPLPRTLDARTDLDRIAARLSGCACSPG